jgi:hypothetical protein
MRYVEFHRVQETWAAGVWMVELFDPLSQRKQHISKKTANRAARI